MTDLLERAIETARHLPPEVQADIARIMLRYVGEEQPVVHLTPEEEASFAKSRAQAARRDLAPDEQVRAIWSKHGL